MKLKIGDYVRYIGPFHEAYVIRGQNKLAGRIIRMDDRKIEIEIDGRTSTWGDGRPTTEAEIGCWESTETDMGAEMKDALAYYIAIADGQLS